MLVLLSSTASASERAAVTIVAEPVTTATVVPLPTGGGGAVLLLPPRVARVVADAYDALRDAVGGDAAVAKATTVSPHVAPVVRELAFERTPEIETFIRYFTAGRGRGVAIRGVARSEALQDDARRIFREEGVPPDLIWLAQVESAWQPTAVSPAGACGIWQFIPATGERFGMSCTGDASDERMDFEKSTRGAARYLRWLNERYDGNWPLAIGAYNCGEGAMDRAIARAGGVEDFWVLSRAGLLPQETANYVPAVLAATIFGSDPARFELDNRFAVEARLTRP